MPARASGAPGGDGAQAPGPALGAGNNASSHSKNPGAQQQTLGANWQSALCVTSVYDAMAQLQQENDALREELRVAKQTHALFATKTVEAEQPRELERVNVCEKHEQEIRLLRREKLRLERLGEQQRATLEARVREAETACQQQIAKYQEKYALDPNAAKRVALSVQTLRDTLEKVVEEKEELAIRYSQLNQLYTDLQQEHSKMVGMLQGKIAGLKAQRGMQRVVSVLYRWSTSSVERAWRIWSTQTRIDRVQTEERLAALQTQSRLQEHVSRLMSLRLGEMLSRSELSRFRESFELWRAYSSVRRRHKQIVSLVTLSRSQRATKSVLESWRAISRSESDCRAGLERLSSLLNRHKSCKALRKWAYRTQVECPRSDFIQERRAMQHKIAELTDALYAARQELESTQHEKQQLVSSHTDERQNADEILKQKLQMELAIKEKVGRYLRRQSDRHLLLGVMPRWRTAAVLVRSLNKRVEFVRARLCQRRLRLSVVQWRRSIDEDRKYAAIIHRLKSVRVVRCFNSWKQATSEASARKGALRHAVFKMQHLQTVRCFAQWRDFHDRQRRVKRQFLWLASWVEKRRLSQALSQWKSHLRSMLTLISQQQLEQSRELLECEYTQQKQQLILMLKCFYQWRQHVKAQTERTKLLNKHAARLQNSVQLRAMRSWMAFCDSRKQARELVQRRIYRSYTGHLTIALARWKQFALSETHSATYEQLVQQHDSQIDLMKQQLACFRMMHEELHQRFAVAQEQHKDTFQGVLVSLHTAKRRQQRFYLAVDTICCRNARLIALRKALVGWHEVADDIRANSHIVHDFRVKASGASRKAVFTVWKKQWARRKRIVTTVNRLKRLHQFYSLGVVWDCWVDFRSQQKRFKEFARLCLSRTNTCCLADVIRGWRRVARTNHLLKTAVANALHRSATDQMRFAFSTWLSISRELAAAEKEARRKQILDDMRAMISVKWSLSVARTVFVSWKSVVAMQQAQRKAGERLRAWYQRCLLQNCISAWQISLDKQAELDTWLRRWMTKTVTRKQERALRVWKSAVLRTQMEDVQTLRALYEQERTDARQYKEEVYVLQASSDAMSEKLVEIETTHAHNVRELERVTRLVCLLRWFGAWKLRVQDERRLSHVLCAFSRSCQRKRVAFFMDQWYAFVQDRRLLGREAEERRLQLQLRTQRVCFQRWRLASEAKVVLKRKEKVLHGRFVKKRKQEAMESWRSFAIEARTVSAGVNQLNQALRAVELRVRFSQWVEASRSLKWHEQRIRERQLRLEELTERVHERRYNTVMTAWLYLVKTRRSRLQNADSRFRLKCLETKRVILGQWKAHIQLLSRQRSQLDHLIRIRQKAVFRSALRSWTKYAHRMTVGSLAQENRLLARQQEQTNQELQATATDLDKLKAALAHTRSVLNETESRLTNANSQWTHKEVDSLKTAARATALQKLLLRRFVPQSVARSFRLWREQCEAMEACYKAVRLFGFVMHRQLRLHAFSRWKEDCTLARNRQRFLEATRIRALRRFVRHWKRLVSRRTTAKLFLARRFLVYLAGPQRLTWGFRQWRLTTDVKRANDHIGVLNQDVRRRSEQMTAAQRRFLLAKWLWTAYFHRLRQMRAFIVRCQAIVTAATRTDHERAIRLLRDTHARENIVHKEKAVQALIKSAQRAQRDACNCEAVLTGPSLRAIKALLHRISQSTALHEVFTSVSGTFGQFLHGCSAILFLFDPSSNELWTQRENNRIIQVPVSIGITGCTLSSGSMVDVENMLEDPRFHPMVDQLVLGELRTSEAQTSALGTSSTRFHGSSGKPIGLLSAPLLSNDGAVYGVLQVAVPTSSLSAKQARTNKLQAQLLARTCATIIEQLLAELLRNCRDRVRSRTPDRFAKLFKQNKNWRKYYAALERKCVTVQDQLRAVSEERHALVEKANEVQVEVSAMKSKLETYHSTEREFVKQVTLWKKKLLKLKVQLDAKEALVGQKTRELQTVVDEFQRYRKHQRSKELDAALHRSPDSRIDKESRDELAKDDEFSGAGQLAMLRADYMTVKNLLVRAESDNLLLVRALEMARQNDGQLPAGIVQEVARIALRVTKDS